MAGSFSDYAELKILDHLVGKTSFTMPTAYLALSTADPTDSGAGMAEPSGGAYARKVTAGSDWAAAASGANQTAENLTFTTATGAWGTITHFALYDAATAGNMLAHGSLSASKVVANGDTFQFDAGDIDITLT